MKGLLTAKEARTKLGVTDDKFQYMVRTGLIEKVILPGRKYGMYPEKDVNRLAAAITATLEQYTKSETLFEQATQADLPEIIAMCAKNMPRVTPLEKQRSWMKRNPDAFYTLRDNGEVVAYTCLLPVNLNWLMRVLKDEMRIGDVPLEEIYPFTTGKPLDLYIRDLIVDQTVGREKATRYAQRILAEIAHVITQLGSRDINIRAIYALATTPKGNQLARKLGFRAMTELDNQTEGYMAYEIVISETNSPLIDDYKAEIRRYHKQTDQEKQLQP